MNNAFDQNEVQKAVDMAWDAIVKAAYFRDVHGYDDEGVDILADAARDGFVRGIVVA